MNGGLPRFPIARRFVLANATLPACSSSSEPPAYRTADGLVRTDIRSPTARSSASRHRPRQPPAFPARPRGRHGLAVLRRHPHPLDKGHIWPRTPNPDGTFIGAARSGHGDDREAQLDGGTTSPAHGIRPALRLCPRHVAAPHPSRFAAAAARDLLAGLRGMRDALGRPDRAAGRQHSSAIDAFARVHGLRGRYRRRRSAASSALSRRLPPFMTPPSFDELLERLFRLAMDRGLDLDLHVDESERSGAPARSDRDRRHGAPPPLQGPLQRRPLLLARRSSPTTSSRRRCAPSPRPASPSSACPCATCTCRTAHAGRTPRWRGVTLLHELKARRHPCRHRLRQLPRPFLRLTATTTCSRS